MDFTQILHSINESKINTEILDNISELIPGWLHVNNTDDFGLEYVSPSMELTYGFSREDIINGGTTFLEKYVHPESTKQIVPKLKKFIEENDNNKILSFFQYIRTRHSDYRWYLTSLRLLPKGKYVIAITNLVENIEDLNHKVEEALNDIFYVKKNLKKFHLLTKREIEIIEKLSMGLNNTDIAETLHVSKHTIKTHRQNIYKKLEITSIFELISFAKAFNI